MPNHNTYHNVFTTTTKYFSARSCLFNHQKNNNPLTQLLNFKMFVNIDDSINYEEFNLQPISNSDIVDTEREYVCINFSICPIIHVYFQKIMIYSIMQLFQEISDITLFSTL